MYEEKNVCQKKIVKLSDFEKKLCHVRENCVFHSFCKSLRKTFESLLVKMKMFKFCEGDEVILSNWQCLWSISQKGRMRKISIRYCLIVLVCLTSEIRCKIILLCEWKIWINQKKNGNKLDQVWKWNLKCHNFSCLAVLIGFFFKKNLK